MRAWRTTHWNRRDQIKTTLRTLWHRQGRLCAYCRRRTVLPPKANDRVAGVLYASRDHRHPRVRGGGDERGNLVMACEPCNRLKADRPWSEWVAFMMAHPKWWEAAPIRAERLLEEA